MTGVAEMEEIEDSMLDICRLPPPKHSTSRPRRLSHRVKMLLVLHAAPVMLNYADEAGESGDV